MKLSEMKNKDAIKATVMLMPQIKKILADRELLNIWFRKLDLEVGMTEQEVKLEQSLYATEKFTDLIPLALEKHEEEIYKIIAIINGMDYKEVAEQEFATTISQIFELLDDEALAKLFTIRSN